MPHQHDDQSYLTSSMGTGAGIEKIVASGNGGLLFQGNYYEDAGPTGKDVTGTAVADTFWSFGASDIMRGGAGNDTFHIGGGLDKVFSETNDADTFYFDHWQETSATITGFNGAGFQGGDRIYVDPGIISNPNTMIKEVNGTTQFATGTGYTITVDKVGLVEGVDWFFL